jgi:hypothetical protein
MKKEKRGRTEVGDFIPLRSSRMRQVSCSPLMAMCSDTFRNTRDSIPLIDSVSNLSVTGHVLFPQQFWSKHVKENMSFEA